MERVVEAGRTLTSCPSPNGDVVDEDREDKEESEETEEDREDDKE
jgi:hypothetical protein